jgi:imidazolonepropionase-like amidohydrolase
MKWLMALAVPASLLAAPTADTGDSFLLRGGTIHTLSGAQIDNGSVLVRNGKIIGVGKDVPAPKDVKIIDAKGLHVYPGMFDAATEIGLVEVNAVRETLDTTEIGRFNPQLVSLTAVNPSSEHIPVTRANGITTVATLPQGPLISGQVSLIHLDGWTTDEMGVSRTAGLHLRIPFIQVPTRPIQPDDTAAPSGESAPNRFTEAKRNFDKQMAELNEFFDTARRYREAKNAKALDFRTDLKLEAMIPVIEGNEPVLVTAIREREIRDAIAFADKQKLKIILCEAPEAYKVIKEIKERDIPVILGPTLALPINEDDPYDRAYTTPAELQRAGIRFAIGTFTGTANLSSRNLPYEAAQAVAFGLPHDDALRAITRSAAEIWGVGDRIGTIEEGKWADLMVTDGDPLEAPTQVRLLFIKGKAVDLDNKQKRLNQKYSNRP